MNHGRWTLCSLLAPLLACSAEPRGGLPVAALGGDTDAGELGTPSGATSSGGTRSSGGSSGGTSTGTGDPGGVDAGGGGVVLGDASTPESDLGTPVVLTMDSFTVQPNSEVYMCQQFGNPFGKDVDLVKMVGSMSMGSHHFFLFNMTPSTGRNATAALAPCPDKGLEFHPFPYLSQQPEYTVQYGAGMGYPLVGQNGVMMNVHYLNASAMPVTPRVTITIYPAQEGTVATHVGTVFLNNQTIYVPSGTTMAKPLAVSNSNTPISDESYTIFTHWSHMHQYALDFQASTGGKVFYDETQWSEPPLITAGSGTNQLPLAMKAGASIAWTCLYYNPTPQLMTFGDSAATNDMCIYLGQYYPAEGTPATNPNYPDVIVSQR